MQDNQKLVPSVTRVFKKEQDMFVFLEAYQPDATTTQPIVATVSFYRGKVKAFETAPLQVTEGLNAKSKALPVRFSVPLGKLAPGPLHLPGERARSGRPEVRLLARAHRDGAVGQASGPVYSRLNRAIVNLSYGVLSTSRRPHSGEPSDFFAHAQLRVEDGRPPANCTATVSFGDTVSALFGSAISPAFQVAPRSSL